MNLNAHRRPLNALKLKYRDILFFLIHRREWLIIAVSAETIEPQARYGMVGLERLSVLVLLVPWVLSFPETIVGV
jgi:hypothetical protein